MPSPAATRIDLEPIELLDVVRYAGASGDFNPIHYDLAHARSQGFPTSFAQGLFTAGLLGVALTQRYGPLAVQELAVRFRAPLFLGAAPSLTITPTDDRWLDLGVLVDGATVASGRARVTSASTVAPASRVDR